MKTSTPSNPVPVYVIFGSEDFLRAQALRDVTREVLGDDPEVRCSMACVEFDGDSVDVAAVLVECQTPSLLAPIRLICVRNADDFVSHKPPESASTAGGPAGSRGAGRRVRRPLSNRELLERYLQSPSPSGVLVLECQSWPANTKLYKLVDQIGRNIPCEKPRYRTDLHKWVSDHARRAHGCGLEFSVAERLVDLVGNSMGLLDSELGKLATYVAPRKVITIEDVETLVGATREEKIFAITDAIAQRDAARAVALWEQVLSTDRDAPFRAIGGLAYGFRRLAEGRRQMDQGVPPATAVKAVKPWARPQEVPEIKRQLDRFSLREWHNHLAQLLKIDAASKSGLGDVPTAVEKFIINLLTAAPSAGRDRV